MTTSKFHKLVPLVTIGIVRDGKLINVPPNKVFPFTDDEKKSLDKQSEDNKAQGHDSVEYYRLPINEDPVDDGSEVERARLEKEAEDARIAAEKKAEAAEQRAAKKEQEEKEAAAEAARKAKEAEDKKAAKAPAAPTGKAPVDNEPL